MADQPTPQPFGILPSSLPPLTTPSSIPTPTSYIYTLPTHRHYNHIVVFLLPGITLPPSTAAAVYISIPKPLPQPSEPEFKFLGAIGEGKESAIFKISGLVSAAGGAGGGEVDMEIGSRNPGGNGTMPAITIGISLEPADEVAAKLSSLPSPNATAANTSQALIPSGGSGTAINKQQTVKLAQKIIKNAFNFLASFSGNTANGVEVVPLKAFEGWWRKFEGRVVNDPGFLEREDAD